MEIQKHISSIIIGVAGALIASLVTLQITTYRVEKLEQELVVIHEMYDAQQVAIQDNKIELIRALAHLENINRILQEVYGMDNGG